MSMHKNHSFLASSFSSLFRTSLTWKIDNISHRNDYMESPTFTDELENAFHLFLEPNTPKGDIGVSICPSELNLGELEAKYKLSVIDAHGQKCLSKEGFQSVSVDGNISFPEFVSFENISKHSNEYLPGDTLTIHCELSHIEEGDTILSPAAGSSQTETTQKTLADYGSLLKSGNLADVKLIVGGKTISAHKLILSVRSPVFAAMFTHDTKEKQEGQVEIPDVDLEAFETLLDFLYTGTVPILENAKSAQELLIAADKYDAAQLKTVCEVYLISQITNETAPSLLLFADTVNASKLKESALEFIRNRCSELLQFLKVEEPEQMINMFAFLSKQI